MPTADALFVGDLLGGPSQIRRFGLDGKGETIIPIPKISAVQEMVALEDDSLLFRDHELYRAGSLVPLCRRKKPSRENGAAQHFAGLICRYRSDARIRDLKGRHENSAQYHFPQKE